MVQRVVTGLRDDLKLTKILSFCTCNLYQTTNMKGSCDDVWASMEESLSNGMLYMDNFSIFHHL